MPHGSHLHNIRATNAACLSKNAFKFMLKALRGTRTWAGKLKRHAPRRTRKKPNADWILRNQTTKGKLNTEGCTPLAMDMSFTVAPMDHHIIPHCPRCNWKSHGTTRHSCKISKVRSQLRQICLTPHQNTFDNSQINVLQTASLNTHTDASHLVAFHMKP